VKKILILSLIILTSCSYFFKKKTERVLAKAYGEYLYESDLMGVIPKGTAPGDSVNLARSFIDTWVRQKLIIHQAENNLNSQQMDFSDQMENYKNSLIIFEYENELVKQKLDTVISNEEIESYYAANQQNFLLKDNIVLMQYVKLPLNSANSKQIKKLLSSDNSEDKTRLSEMSEKLAADYFLDDQNWLLFTNVMNQIPIKTYNQEEFLKNHREVEVQDSAYSYLVRFKDFKIKESVSPISFEKDRIKNVILNKRKIDLINKMHQDVYDKALKGNDFEIFK
jgi:hypothetical protein